MDCIFNISAKCPNSELLYYAVIWQAVFKWENFEFSLLNLTQGNAEVKEIYLLLGVKSVKSSILHQLDLTFHKYYVNFAAGRHEN